MNGGLGFEIKSIWAFVAVHSDGDEGIIATLVGSQWMPLIAADETRLEALRPLGEQAARDSGKPVKLVRFDQRVDLEQYG